jgi:hypothetical protein
MEAKLTHKHTIPAVELILNFSMPEGSSDYTNP